jgi:hypothetical protein
MSKVTLALGSFIVGACTTLLGVTLFGSHTLTFAQAPTSGPVISGPGTMIIGGDEKMPVVLPPTQTLENFNLQAKGLFFVDGTICNNCVFSDADLIYGGGAFSFTQARFSGPIRIRLVGAAANTIAFLNFAQAIGASQQPPKTIPNAPIMRAENVKMPILGDFTAPFNGSK